MHVNSVKIARQWARANGHTHRPIVRTTGVGAAYSLMADISAQAHWHLRELIAAGTKGTFPVGTVHFDFSGITDGTQKRRSPPLPSRRPLSAPVDPPLRLASPDSAPSLGGECLRCHVAEPAHNLRTKWRRTPPAQVAASLRGAAIEEGWP